MFYKIIKEENDLPHMVCSQTIEWITDGFERKSSNGYIVQELQRNQYVDNVNTEDSHYLEAWRVIDGSVTYLDSESDIDYDDGFIIGDPLDCGSDEICRSIGKSGRIEFYAKVYWIDANTDLYEYVDSWKEGAVRTAGNLKSKSYEEIDEQKFRYVKVYERSPFIHDWDFTDPDIIFEHILEHCKKMWGRPGKLNEENFYAYIAGGFGSNQYPDAKNRIIKEWEIGEWRNP